MLKIFGMILIVLFHCQMTVVTTKNVFYPVLAEGIRYKAVPMGVTRLFLMAVQYCGNFGNLIFLICAAWFLCESKRTSLQKVLTLILITWFLSVLNLGVIRLLYPEIAPSGDYIHQCFFPLAYGHNWFITCYLLLYLAHGGINIVLNEIDRQTHLLAASFLIFIYGFVSLFTKVKVYYYSTFTVSVSIYILTVYVRKYCNDRRTAWKLIGTGLAGYLLFGLLTGAGWLQGRIHWDKMSNPFLILLVLGLVVMFSQKCFYNRCVNYLSGLSLILYLIHENKTFRDVVRPKVWEAVSTSLQGHSVIIRFTVFWLIILAYGFGMSVLFHAAFVPAIRRVSGVLENILKKAWIRITNRKGDARDV